MKGGGSYGAGVVGAAATMKAVLVAAPLVLLVVVAVASAPVQVDAAAAVARRLAAAGPNNCGYGGSNPGKGCHRPPGPGQQAAADKSSPASLVTASSVASTGPKPNPCTYYDPATGTNKCLSPPTPSVP